MFMNIRFGRIAATTVLLGTVAAVVPAAAAPAATAAPPSVIAEPDIVTIPEGSSRSFSVRLSQPPTQPVPLRISVVGTGLWASPPIQIIFTPANWNTPQTFPVASMQDPDAVDDSATVRLSATGYDPDKVILLQIDDD